MQKVIFIQSVSRYMRWRQEEFRLMGFYGICCNQASSGGDYATVRVRAGYSVQLRADHSAKCTQKNGERRYSNTSDLIQDLKRSLVDPDGDFVVIPPLRSADTVIITDEELDNIRDSYDDEYDDEYDDNEYEDGYDDDEYDDDEYDDDEYDDDEYDDDEYGRKKRGSEEVNPRMNKIMKILTIVVAVIIVFIAIFAIGKAAGIFKGFGSGITAEETEDKVKVPNVVGKTEEEAKKILNDKKT